MTFSDKSPVKKNKHVLCVGLLCLDIVTVCKDFPIEDTDQRCICSHWQKGGNAANTSAVLSILKQKVDFFGTVGLNNESAKNVLSDFVHSEMESYGVNMTHAIPKPNHETPCSQVIINSKNGSRTIIHNRKSMPELSAEDMLEVRFQEYSFIHFEGRNIEVVLKALQSIKCYNTNSSSNCEKIFVSVEAEKPKRSEVVSLMPYADLIVISKEFAESKYHFNALDAVNGFKSFGKQGAFIVCTWGSAGAAYGVVGNENDAIMVPAIPPKQVVDTLGAGDTFIGGLLCGMIQGKTIGQSVEFGCQIASCKISANGYKHLKEQHFNGFC